MGILDITDEFCNPLKKENTLDSINGNIKFGNKLHEQPIVSFVEKENEQEVIYREEV